MRPIHFARSSRWSRNAPPENADDSPGTNPDPSRYKIGHGKISPMADHHLRLPDRRTDLRSALGHGFLPTPHAGGKGLGPHDIRPRHGAAKLVLGPQPAILRRYRRPLRHLARAVARRPYLCGRPLSDGRRRQPDHAACRRRHTRRPRRRSRLVLDRACGLRPPHAAREAIDRFRHRHRGGIGRHVPVRADRPGPDRRLWLVAGADHHGRNDAGHPAARYPAAWEFAQRR